MIELGGSNEFSLHYLTEGIYEIHFASYEDTNSDGEYEFTGMIEAEGDLGLDLMEVMVSANTEVTIQVILLTILGL